MGARQKLNQASINGSFLIAGVLGVLYGSWTLFVVVFVLLVATGVMGGDIRPTPRR